ncbi:hypothetical protein L207DRAFT_577883 [Hyaloscypha variabilis F]|uniref:Wax synthase domain-containing protein n=1 Tax=Hyaloscypha variabilis (strain UAMH 11265 / GT02V1 / F) TaxID=1149755 RepID=A0A2J6S2G3_HYAVF|nr:hypothetical protein L207DRAFT_577883 [Hyaloscypha variabilis F]
MDIELGPLLKRTIWGPAILFTALIVPKVFYSSYATRLLTFAAVGGSVVWALQPHDVDNAATSYLFGFAPCWVLIVAAVLLLLYNPARDFRRIRRKRDEHGNHGGVEYEWEAFPEQLSKRCWWALDLMMNWRGLGWSYQRRQHLIPDAVKRVYDEAGINVKRDGGPIQTRSSFLLQQSWYFAMDYVLLDLCIYFLDRDPWFNRDLDSNEKLLFGHPAGNYDILVRPYRIFLGTLATYIVMDVAHVALALACVGLGPRYLGTLGEPWQHPPLWGTFDDLFHRGLPGFWGNFWHDLFRFQFLTITRKLFSSSTNDKQSAHGFRGLLAMTFVFALSGFMHAAGSYAELRETAPLWLFAGFAVQSIGVAAQEMITMLMVKGKVGPGVKQAVTIAFWWFWGWLTAPIVIGDMAACGLFQSKVIPYSIVNRLLK